MNSSNAPASETISADDPAIQKANLEGRIEQVNSALPRYEFSKTKYIPKICKYIKARKVDVESIAEHFELRLDKHRRLNTLCKDYQLYSPNLDGSVQEILQKVEEIAENDSLLLAELLERETEGVQSLLVEMKGIYEQLLRLRRKKLDQEKSESGSGEPAVCKQVIKDEA
jgi:hypothetical protein